MITVVRVTLILYIIFLIQSCKEDSSSAPNPLNSPVSSFSVNISIVDTNNNPVPHLRISCWNKLLLISGSLPTPSNTLPSTLASSKIKLNMPIKAKVWMALYDMDNRIVLALYSDNTLWGPGLLEAYYTTGGYRTPWVLKCRCIVKDSLSNILYSDSIYTLCWQPYAERSILGWTSTSGTLSTSDSLLFPNVLALPPLVYTGENGWDSLGTFLLSDTLIFALTDTASHQQQFFEGIVRKAMHDSLRFVWQPTMQAKSISTVRPQTSNISKIQFVKEDVTESGWRLYQNYPNPYYR